MKMKYKRRRIFVDRKVQGALSIRVAVYWFCCLLSVALLSACWTAIKQGPMSAVQLVQAIAPQCVAVLASSLLLLPIIVIDSVRQSNKFAGPMLRIRSAMQQLANGKPVQPIQFRKGDFWYDFAGDFNRVAARVGQETDVRIESAESSPNSASSNSSDKDAANRLRQPQC